MTIYPTFQHSTLSNMLLTSTLFFIWHEKIEISNSFIGMKRRVVKSESNILIVLYTVDFGERVSLFKREDANCTVMKTAIIMKIIKKIKRHNAMYIDPEVNFT